MKEYLNHILAQISVELNTVDIEECNISMDEAIRMIEFLQSVLRELRERFLQCNSISIQDEIHFFKETKPRILSWLLYFNKVYTIELKRPNGSNIIQKNYYENELDSLTFYFNRNLDFYQYYRSCSTHLDEFYFVRGKINIRLCVDSSMFISDTKFSTGYDFKAAKILSNEILRIYLNKRLQHVDRVCGYGCESSPGRLRNKWTGSKAAAIELGYGLYAARVIDNGNADIRDIMMGIEKLLDIDLGDYYRTYIALKNRKKDRTAFLRHLVECLERRMDEEYDV